MVLTSDYKPDFKDPWHMYVPGPGEEWRTSMRGDFDEQIIFLRMKDRRVESEFVMSRRDYFRLPLLILSNYDANGLIRMFFAHKEFPFTAQKLTEHIWDYARWMHGAREFAEARGISLPEGMVWQKSNRPDWDGVLLPNPG